MTKNTDTEAASFDERLLENLDVDVNDDNDMVEAVEQTEPEPTHDPLEAPEFFSKEHKDYFQKLQEMEGGRTYAEQWLNQYNDGQKYITQKSQKVAEERRQYENQLNAYNQYQQALQPVNEIWQKNGIAPQVGVAQMAYYGKLLHTNPQALIQEVAKYANIDLNKVIEEQPYEDPETRNLKNQVQQLQQSIGQFQNHYQQGQTQQQTQAINNVISEFQNSKTPDGNFAYPHIRQDSPHYQKVEQQMAYLMNSPTHGLQQLNHMDKLTQAYQLALNYVPEIQAEIQAANEKAKAEERNAQANKLKNASIRTNSKTKDAPAVMPDFENRLRAKLGLS